MKDYNLGNDFALAETFKKKSVESEVVNNAGDEPERADDQKTGISTKGGFAPAPQKAKAKQKAEKGDTSKKK